MLECSLEHSIKIRVGICQNAVYMILLKWYKVYDWILCLWY